MVSISSMVIRNWRQFQAAEISLHPRLTIITGSNGTGKSTILNIVSQHFGYARPFLGTPRRRKGGGVFWDAGYHGQRDWIDDLEPRETEREEYSDERAYHFLRTAPPSILPPPVQQGAFVSIGSMVYSNGISAEIGYHEQQAQQYGISINNQQSVDGLNITSHRSNSSYQPVKGFDFSSININQMFSSFYSEMMTRFNGGHTPFSPTYRMKEALISMAAFGEGNSYLESNQDLLEAFTTFQAILRKVLPAEIGFRGLKIRIPDIVISTASGDFLLDSSSGGINALFEISWQLFLYSLNHDSFVVTMDEPENHLHPALQRTILSSLLSAFPQAQFIVATHSPFIVSSVEDASVYALRYVGDFQDQNSFRNQSRAVVSIKLDQKDRSGTAGRILREVLGVDSTMPEWAQHKVNEIVENITGQNISAELLERLRDQLTEIGFGEFYPQALSRLVRDQ